MVAGVFRMGQVPAATLWMLAARCRAHGIVLTRSDPSEVVRSMATVWWWLAVSARGVRRFNEKYPGDWRSDWRCTFAIMWLISGPVLIAAVYAAAADQDWSLMPLGLCLLALPFLAWWNGTRRMERFFFERSRLRQKGGTTGADPFV